MKYVVAFDISDDRTRYRAVKILLEYSYRVQKSVFEGFFSKESLEECLGRLEALIDPRTDSVRSYQLCAVCADCIQNKGTGPDIKQVRYVIV